MTLKALKWTPIINGLLILLVLMGEFSHAELKHQLQTIGLYGLSGSITNSLAITMIFKRIPGIIGSGIIEKNFESFKEKLKKTLMEHLFNTGLQLDSWDISSLSSNLFKGIKNSEMAFLTHMISQETLSTLLTQVDLGNILNEAISPQGLEHALEKQIHTLTPEQVKMLITHIIDEHLEWLVAWGAIFGALFGILALYIGL